MNNPTPLSRILIVDESRMVRAMISKHIRDHFDYREESNGEAAWQVLVLDHSIELVICSLSLPVLDGNGLLDRVRSSRLVWIPTPPVPCLGFSKFTIAACSTRPLPTTACRTCSSWPVAARGFQ